MKRILASLLALWFAYVPAHAGSMALLGAGKAGAAAGCSDTNATAWAAAVVTAGGTVSGTQQTRVCNLITAYKSAGVWTLLDREWLYASENATQASIDIVNLSVHTLTVAPTFTANVGYAFVAGSYIDTNYTPGTNFTLNSLTLGAYVNSYSTGTVTGVYGTYSYFKAGSANIEYDADEVGFFTVANPGTVSPGNYIINRTASNSLSVYKNAGTAIGAQTTAPNAIPTVHFYVGGANNGSNAVTDSATETVSSVFYGGGLTSTQAQAKNAALNTYMTSVGANVY